LDAPSEVFRNLKKSSTLGDRVKEAPLILHGELDPVNAESWAQRWNVFFGQMATILPLLFCASCPETRFETQTKSSTLIKAVKEAPLIRSDLI
jgi:hypothetical protein